MSWLSGIADVVGGFFNSGAGKAAVQIGGALLQNKATERAIDAQNAGIDNELAFRREYADKARADLLAAKQAARDAWAPYTGAGPEGLAYTRGVMGRDVTQLTPAEQIQLEDQDRKTRSSLQSVGLLDAGRSGQAVLADQNRRFHANAQAQKQAQADRAAGAMLDTGRSATGAISNAELGVGTSTSNINQQLGASSADAAARRGTLDAIGASDPLMNLSSTFGAVASALANQHSKDARNARYRQIEVE